MKWELLKQEIKKRAIERSSCLKQAEGKEIMELNNLLQQLLHDECLSPGLFSDHIRSLKKRLEALDTERYEGAMIRAKLKRLSRGEIPTKRVIGMEKKYASKNEITEICYQASVCGTLQRTS